MEGQEESVTSGTLHVVEFGGRLKAEVFSFPDS